MGGDDSETREENHYMGGPEHYVNRKNVPNDYMVYNRQETVDTNVDNQINFTFK